MIIIRSFLTAATIYCIYIFIYILFTYIAPLDYYLHVIAAQYKTNYKLYLTFSIFIFFISLTASQCFVPCAILFILLF